MQSKEIDWKEEGKELTKEEKEMSEVEIVKGELFLRDCFRLRLHL